MRSGDWKEENGLVVDKGGEVQRNYYKELAKSSDTEDTDTYNNWMKAYNIDGASNRMKASKKAGLMGELLDYDDEADKAGTAVSLYQSDEFSELPDWVKQKYYSDAGFTEKEVEYATMTNTKIVSLNARLDKVFLPLAKSGDHDQLINTIKEGRRQGITGYMFATDGIVDRLYNEGYISKDEKSYLKKLKLDKNGDITDESKVSLAKGSGNSSSKAASKASSTTTSFKALVDAFEASQKSTVPETSKLMSSTTANTKKTMAKASLRKWSNAQNSKKPVKISIKKGIKTA